MPEDEEDGEYDGPEKIPVAPKSLETRITTSASNNFSYDSRGGHSLLERVQLT